MDKHLKILLIEDNEIDRLLFKLSLQVTGLSTELKEARDAEEGIKMFKEEKFDCVFLDYLLPGMNGLEVLMNLREDSSSSVILITSQGDEKIAVEAMKSGAVDYVTKNQISAECLTKIINNVIRFRKAEQEKLEMEEVLRQSERRYRIFFEKSQGFLCTHDLEGNIINVNRPGARSINYSVEELIGKNLKDLVSPNTQNLFEMYLEKIKKEKSAMGQMQILSKDGKEHTWVYHNYFHEELNETYIIFGAQDITDRIRMREERINAKKVTQESNEIKKLLYSLNQQKVELQYSEEKLKKSEAHLKVQYAISQQLSTDDSLTDALHKIIETVCKGLGYKCGAFWAVDKDADALFCTAFWQTAGMSDTKFQEITKSIPFISGYGIPGRIWKSQKPLWIGDLRKDERFSRVPFAIGAHLNAVFGFPILFDNTLVGVLEFFDSVVHEPDTELIQMFEASSKQIGQFIVRKRTEERIKESEERYKQLVEEASDLIYRTDNKGHFVYVNSVTTRIIGIPENKIIGRHFTELVHPSFRDKVIQFYKDQFSMEIPLTYLEFMIESQEEGNIWIGQNVKAIYEGNRIVGFQAMARNITDRKNAEEQIKLSEEKFRHIIENMELGLLEVDTDDNIIQPNEKFCLMTGYANEELVGKSILDKLFTGKRFKSRLSLHNLKKILGKTNVYEIQMQRKDGKIIWALISEAPLFDINKNIIGSIGIYLDITERKNFEEELRKAKELAENSKRVKEQFLTNMSHEIRTPMNAIMGITEILQENNPSSEQKECIDAIKLSADNLLAVINDILDFSKLESGKITFENVPFSLQNLLEGIIQTLHFTASKKSISLIYSIANTIPPVIVGDFVRLRQILLNLASNSIKFTDKGSVRIDVKLKEHEGDNYTLLFSVIDTGIGIPEDKLTDIFESFTQASGDTTRKYGGTGLGLTITKQLIELQGGTVSVKSKINEGSVFTVGLDFRKGTVENILEKNAEAQPSYTALKGVKALLVEDNMMNQLLAKKILNKWGLEFDIADNGRIAIEKLLKSNYEIILMDLQMPEMDGYETTRYIRENIQFPKSNIPIIAITANAIVGETEKCIAVGMNEYISKPFNQNVLYEKMLNLLGRKEGVCLNHDGNSLNTRSQEKKSKYSDLTYLAEIAEGSNEFMVDMINTFILETPPILDDMDRFLIESRWNELRNLAHKLKPTIDFMGIHAIREVVKDIEKFAKEKMNLDLIPGLMTQVSEICLKAIEELKIEVKFLNPIP